MNKMKKKLMASIAMLVISTILMTSTSYAWYTINTKATAGDVAVTLAQTKNVEIAKVAYDVDKDEYALPCEVTYDDGDENLAFGGQVSFGTAADAPKLQLPAKMISATDVENNVMARTDSTTSTLADGDLVGVYYTSSGRTDGYVEATQEYDTSTRMTKYTYTYEGTGADAKKATIAFAYNVYVRSNVEGDLVLSYTKVKTTNSPAQVAIKYADMGTEVSDSMGDPDYVSASFTSVVEDTTATTGNTTVENTTVSGKEAEIHTVTFATPDDDKDGNEIANHIFLVQIFCYFNGDAITAEDMTNGPLDATLYSLTFKNSAIEEDGAYPEQQSWEPKAALGWFEDEYDATVGQDLVLDIAEDISGTSAFSITVDGTKLSGNYVLAMDGEEDTLTLKGALFTSAKEYKVVVTNDGKSDTFTVHAATAAG